MATEQVFPHWYYLLVDPDKPKKCKLGITINPKQRLRAYRTAAPSCYFKKLYPNFNRVHERPILDVMRDVAMVQSEYVHFHPDLVQNIVEAYFDDNNITYKRD